MGRQFTNLPLVVLFLTLTSTVLASNTWYVDGVTGSDANDCQTALTACKTIGHAISLASPVVPSSWRLLPIPRTSPSTLA